MAILKVEICRKKKSAPEHKYSVTFVSKVGTTRLLLSGRSNINIIKKLNVIKTEVNFLNLKTFLPNENHPQTKIIPSNAI